MFASLIALILLFTSYQSHTETIRQSVKEAVYASGVDKLLIAQLEIGLDEDIQQSLDLLRVITDAKLAKGTSLKGNFSSTATAYSPSGLDIHTVLPIKTSDGKALGRIDLYHASDNLFESVISPLKYPVLMLLVYSLLVSILAFLIVSKILTQPMKQIAHQFHQITPGEDDRIDTPQGHEDNEISDLVGDLNTLLDSVQETIENERQLNVKNEALSRKFRFIFERASAGIGLIDGDNRLVVANPALMRLFGQTVIAEPENFKNADFFYFFNDKSEMQDLLEEFRTKPGNAFTSIDILLRRKLKSPDRWVHCLLSKVEDLDDPDTTLLELVVYDITERAEREQNIIFEAEHDPVTHLLNRRAAMSKLSAGLRQAEDTGRYFALMMIDLDGFKNVNDTYGHDAGDKVIIDVAKRIRQFFRSSDVVSRWGGDEFLIGFSYSPEYESAVTDIATDLQTKIAQSIDIGHEQSATVGSSLGISLFPQKSKNLHTLIEQADSAMYYVKNNGKNFFHFYTSDTPKMQTR